MNLHIDFETFSEVDIKQVGSYRYATDPSTRVLMLGYGKKLWEPHLQKMPEDLRAAIEDPDQLLHAFNAQFERLIFKHVLGIDIPSTRFRCTMVKAYSMGFKGNLGEVQDAIGFHHDVRKLHRGRYLIHRFCKPQPKNHKTRIWNYFNDPEGWEELKDYCRQDVVAESELELWLDKYKPMSQTEWSLYVLDQKINDVGVPIDVDYATGALALHRKAKHEIKERLAVRTGLANPLSNAQMRKWLDARGVTMENLRAETIENHIEARAPFSDILAEYSKAVSTAPTKYKAFLKCEVNGRVHGMFQFHGAQRTARWAGRLVQLQNLKRGNVDPLTALAIEVACLACINQMGDPIDILAQGVRSTITAPEGKSLNVSDLSSIESRVLGWIANCDRMNRVFAEGKDTYRDFAVELFGQPYDTITKEQRTFAKPPVLGAGYGLGKFGMQKYAASMGVTMTEADAERAVYTFRETYVEVTYFWGFVMDAIENLLTKSLETRTPYLRFTMSPDKKFLWITLPSGRRLSYYKPLWTEWDTPVGRKPSFTYEGINRNTLKWEQIAAHHGLITENIVQAIARDILCVWMLRADQAGFNIILHVHDEIGSEETGDRLKELNQLVLKPIPWAPGLLLNAEGYTAERYRK